MDGINNQRFGDGLNINVHFHMLALDGVYAEDSDGFIRFHAVAPPSDAEVGRVAGHIARRVEKLMLRRGTMSGEEHNDQPFLTELYGVNTVQGRRKPCLPCRSFFKKQLLSYGFRR